MKKIILFFLISFIFISAQDSLQTQDTLWYNGQDLSLYGKGYKDVESYYDRLPAKAKDIVREPVWCLSHNSAGMYIKFITNSDKIAVKWKLINKVSIFSNMTSALVDGIDLYYLKNGKWIFAGNGRPVSGESGKIDSCKSVFYNKYASDSVAYYMLYLPLYNGIKDLQIGIPRASGKYILKNDADINKRPIVIYGTSITQGASASRPGMCYTAMIQRAFDYPVVNLGFSGNGRMEPEIMQLISELDPVFYIIDCHHNMSLDEVKERIEPGLRLLKKVHPNTPILFIEGTQYDNEFPTPRGQFTKDVIAKLTKEGLKDLYFLEGNDLVGDDFDGTIDTTHPNDLGFKRMADIIISKIKELNLLKITK